MTNSPGDGQPPQDPANDPSAPQQPPPPPPPQQYGYPAQGYPAQGYPAQGYAPQGYAGYPADHPKATTSLVLGILSVVLCQLVGPFAWSIGKKTLAEIDASGGQLGGRGSAQAGYVLGIVGTVLLGLWLVLIIVYVVIIIAAIGAGTTA